MAYIPLLFPPGVSRRNTEAQAGGNGSTTPPRYWDSNLVRDYGDLIGPVRGWSARTETPITGKGRAVLAWEANSGARHVAIGTESHLYGITTNGVVSNITPLGFVSGAADSGSGGGFGGGAFGSGAFGTARPDTGVTTEATVHDLDTFGEDLVGVSPADGTPYYWELDVATRALAIPNAPTQCSGLVVTAQRAVMVFGASGDGRNVAWSDLEDFSDWTPDATNQAGDFDITTKGAIRKGLRVGDDVLILTSVDAWKAQYVGPPFIYGFTAVGHGCGVLSKGAAIPMGQQVMWWSDSGFWLYDGTACTPVPCDLEDLVKTDINVVQIAKISGFHNTEFSELCWDYPSGDSLENDTRIRFNYRTGAWWLDKISRLASCEKGPFKNPMSVGPDGLLYDHEHGYNYDGATPYVETGPIRNGLGDRTLTVNGLVGDEKVTGDATAQFFFRDQPGGPEVTVDPVPLTALGYAEARFEGRRVKMRISGAAASDWRFGTAALDAEVGGYR